MSEIGCKSVTLGDYRREPLVSVLVPAYNHEKYVIDCLNSIKRSKYVRLELILSDDGSSDDTYETARRWIENNAARFERAIVVKQPVNLGIVRHMQFLFDSARGDYLTYVASDDLLVESGITTRVHALEVDTSIDAVFGNAQLISEAGIVLREQHIPPYIMQALSSRYLMLLSILIHWCVPGPGLMLRRRAVEEYGSLGRLPSDLEGEDRYIYVRLASQGKLGFVESVVAKFRAVPTSTSRPPSRQRYVHRYMLESDKRNRSAVGGIYRVGLESAILKHRILLASDNVLLRKAVAQVWRTVTFQLRVASFIRRFALKTAAIRRGNTE